MLINYVRNGGAATNGVGGLNGKSGLKSLLKRSLKRSPFIDNNNISSGNSDIIGGALKTSDSELEQLISGDENFDIDDAEMFVGDRIALETFGQGIGSSNCVDPSLSSSALSSARRHQRNSFVINP